MYDLPALTLRYFDCRGRAQPFRYFLRARNIAFVDARVAMKDGFAAWQPVKSNPQLSGPFRKLPVLHYGEQLIAESAVIHDWLHHKTGDDARLGEQDNLQHAMLSSSCRSELMTTMALLLWQDAMYPGVELNTTVPASLKRVLDHLQVLEATLQDWHWFAKLPKRQLMLADCTLWEVLSVAQAVFGSSLEWNKLPGLQTFLQQGPAATLFNRMLADHPCQCTGRPQETEAILRIQAALAAAPQ